MGGWLHSTLGRVVNDRVPLHNGTGQNPALSDLGWIAEMADHNQPELVGAFHVRSGVNGPFTSQCREEVVFRGQTQHCLDLLPSHVELLDGLGR